jgi:adhesin transport system outer membrane protein
MLMSERGNARQASFMVEQPIWAAGRISGSVKRARADQQAAVAAYQDAVLQIMLDVAQSWTEYHRLDRRHAVLERSLAEHRTLVETMKRRIAQEISPLSDLELAQSRTAQIEQQVTTTAAQRTTSLQRLRELVGDPGFRPVSPPSLPDMNLPESAMLVAQALEFDPVRRRLVAEADSASAQASVARASTLPQLSGQYSYNESYGHRVGLVLRAQSDGGFSRFAAASAARDRQDAAELRIATQERQLREKIIADISDLDAARQRIESTRTARGATARVTESYMRQFVSGRRSWLDVMNAVREGTTAENDEIDAEASAVSAYHRLLMRSGGWLFPVESADRP